MIALPINPMLSMKVESPGADELSVDEKFPVLERGDTMYEPKWDGHRLIVSVQGGKVRVWTRSQRDVTSDWPEIRSMFVGLTADYVFDGELLCLDEHGRPSIAALGLAGRLSADQRMERIRYAMFDVLEVGGVDLQRKPYVERRANVEQIVPWLPRVMLTPSIGDGRAMWNAIIVAGMEGVIAKPKLSRYLQGERGQWLKLKALQRREFLVIGYTAGEGSRTGAFGAIVLGERGVDGEVHYAGKCGTGWNDRSSNALLALMRPFETDEPPLGRAELIRIRQKIGPRRVTWVRPAISGVVEFAERTADGIPRFPAWKGVSG